MSDHEDLRRLVDMPALVDFILSSDWLARVKNEAAAEALEEAAIALNQPQSGASYEMWSSDCGTWLHARAAKHRKQVK